VSEASGRSDLDRVIADPLRFKQRLRIGRRAFRTLQAKDRLQDVWDTAGVAWTGAAVAKSSVIATTFFAPTGLTAWLGLATAATPAGWVVAAAVGSAGLYYCITRGLAANEHFVDEIPKFISTPLDLLAASLFGLMGTLAVRVAASDGQIDPAERAAIIDHLVMDWGYAPEFVMRELARLETLPEEPPLDAVAASLAEFQAANPDCHGPAMQKELLVFVEEIIRADGVVTAQEAAALGTVRAVLADRKTTFAGSLLGSAGSTLDAAGGMAGRLARTVRRRLR
jgi:hypothetical protein